ncbi:MAG TPA: NAD(P)/FAD-dependent oxidoreductase [Gemmatimonadales bacterium]|nr:NAD(P)/FAD-dependent oxidoreductase [Gemmatimonadales bacterium]
MASSIAASADVLIAGAGPAGSATAALLARAGWRVVVAERAAFPREKACADYLSPGALRVLDRLGILGRIDARAEPLDGIRVTAARGARLEGIFARAGATPFRAQGLCLPRAVLDAELMALARAAGATVLERTAVEALVHEDGGIGGAVVRGPDGRSRALTARVTIGADGLRSLVAKHMGRRMHGRPRRLAFVAHMEGVAGPAGRAEMFVADRRYAGVNPLPAGRVNVALVVPAEEAREARGRAEPFFREALGRFPALAERVARAPIVRRVLVTGPFAARSRRVIAHGGALVGDAADFFDPFTGDGVCSALRGAELLAASLSRALAHAGPVRASALASYAAARRRAFAGKWVVERLIAGAMAYPALFDAAVGRLERRNLAHRLVAVTGELLPAGAVLNPRFLARMVL